jgi:malonate decarboxylase delta subunit
METLQFHFRNQGATRPVGKASLVGVVGSGNLEVLIEPAPAGAGCAIEVHTAALGFAPIWQAVMEDFNQRWQLGDVSIAINDMGATPAVVSLRLDQAVEAVEALAPSAPQGKGGH